MRSGPPYQQSPDNKTEKKWETWREDTNRLEQYSDRDIRIIFPKGKESIFHRRAVADFGDFDPKPTDPDPDIWPLKKYDPGYPADVDDLFLWHGTFPEPHVAWVTKEYLKKRYGYNPLVQELDKKEVPKWKRREIDSSPPYKVRATNKGGHKMTLSEERLEALRRIANLWNGETVNGKHLVADKLPGWTSFLGDLLDEDLRRLLIDPNIDFEFAEAFKDHGWYDDHSSIFLKPQHILRKKVWYSPTQKGISLINHRPELPELNGDPRERLKHRVGVGLTTLDQTYLNGNIATYADGMGYSFDVIRANPDNDELVLIEIITDHNNNKLHRDTYRKLKRAHQKLDATPICVFDKRSTAYRVLNHWHKKGLGSIPNGPFKSQHNLKAGRKRIQNAFVDSADWIIQDWLTFSQIWRYYNEEKSRREIKNKLESVNW